MIGAAELRAQISQIDKFNAAVHTFRLKYSALPGDMTPDLASTFGFATRMGGLAHGDGNGLLDPSRDFAIGSGFGGETSLFWNDLSTAQLVAGNYVGSDCEEDLVNCGVAIVSSVLPTAKAGSGNYIIVYADQVNYFQILGGITSIGGYGSFLGVGSALTPIQAYSIDTKMDDSFPLTGRVTANSSAYGNLGGGSVPPLETPAAPSNTVCVSSASGSPYNVNASTGGTNTSCSIRWAFQ